MANNSCAKKLGQATRELITKDESQLSLGASFQYQQLQLSQKLHTTLDLESLIDLYFESLLNQYGITSLIYFCPNDGIEISLGSPTEFHYGQRLFADEDFLGTMTIYCQIELKESDEKRIRQLTQIFAFSLRNALAFSRLKLSSQTDFLTGAGNRAAMEASLEREFELAQRHDHPLSVLMLDIDYFKAINDQYGHPFGDKVLKALVDELKLVARTSDTVFRFGGEEFVLILSNTNTYGAVVIAERLRKAAERLRLVSDSGKSVSLTISIGAATLHEHEYAKTLIQRADEQLYLAKSNGRNQVRGNTHHIQQQNPANEIAIV
ncbi:MAG: GGDEF domain-containing protein [Pseudomonadales bacterium]|nr:GGDEF domain-containing protein [Pseudomonadales bacterium]